MPITHMVRVTRQNAYTCVDVGEQIIGRILFLYKNILRLSLSDLVNQF